MKNKKRLKVVTASLFALISLVLLISQIDNHSSVSTEVSLVDSTSLIAASVIPSDKSAIVIPNEDSPTLEIKPFGKDQILYVGADCFQAKSSTYGSFTANQKKNLETYDKYKIVTDLNSKLSLANSSKTYAIQKLDEANKALKLFGEIKKGEIYNLVVYPKGIESNGFYGSVSDLHYACVGSKNEPGKSKIALVGTMGNSSYKILSDDPKGYKNLPFVTTTWNNFAAKGKLGYTELLVAFKNSDDYDISLDDRREVSNRDKVVISVTSSGEDCIKVDFKNRKEEKLKENACASKAVREEYSKYIEDVLKNRVKDYSEKVKNYSKAVKDLEDKISGVKI